MHGLRRILHAELRNTDAAYERHLGRDSYSSRCYNCTCFAERMAALRWALQQAGGRTEPEAELTTIDDYTPTRE